LKSLSTTATFDHYVLQSESSKVSEGLANSDRVFAWYSANIPLIWYVSDP